MALHARDEHELIELANALERAGLRRHLIIEKDPPYAGQAMAIGIAPCDRREVRKHVRHLKLLGQN